MSDEARCSDAERGGGGNGNPRASAERARARAAAAESMGAGIRFDEARRVHARGELGDAELACAYVAERVYRKAGSRWLQAERRPPLPSASPSPWVQIVAARELCRVPAAVPRALVAWAEGARPVDLLFDVPSPLAILARQARGRRVVSLLDDGACTAPHEDGLAFAVHDLCHLEKFVDPLHHVEQVGFFALTHAAFTEGRLQALEASLDDLFRGERDHVIADMNGSAAFLFLTLRGKLKLAVRRRVARRRGTPCAAGPLDAEERAACDEADEALFDLFDLRGEARLGARRFTSRGSDEAAAASLVAHFAEAGAAALRGA
jgi:hypothetical protein